MDTLLTLARQLAAPFAIDLRTLALFRVCLGAIIVSDLVTRASSLAAHYTDEGVWPRDDAARALLEFGFSIHLISGNLAVQVGLFVVAGIVATLFIVGYRTRVVSIASWVMLASLNHRNYLILQTSDTLLLSLLFWSIFLPLGARYSVDAALNERAVEPVAVCSLPSAALIVQVLSVYFFGALLKTGEVWLPRGDAVYFALHFSAYASQFGTWLGRELPHDVLRGLTYFVWWVELLGPVVVLLPFLTNQIRAVILPAFILMHVGFAFLLMIGIYPYLSIASLTVLVPTRFWDFLRARLISPERAGLRIYFDGPCTLCRKVCLLLRTFLLPTSTPIVPAQDHPDVQRILEEHNSWVVEDFDGRRYVRWAAMIIIFKRSWLLSPVAPLLDTAPLRALGECCYSWVATNRHCLGRITERLLPYRSFDVRLPWVVNLMIGGLMLMVVYANTASLKQVDIDYPWTFTRITTALLLKQRWTMFAPEPGRTTHWLFVEGTLADGTKVDVYNDHFTPPVLSKPQDGSGYFHDYRWRKYFNAANPGQHWGRLATYYCRRWNRAHQNSPVMQVTGYLLTEHTSIWLLDGKDQWTHKLRPLPRIRCV
ncbi:MAG: putative DCC family thiol-disulfide oxidoreductase YuxK [Gammaproteobacteria bacterium]|jgi:predicted DCC family thiol-disulfide oxidoreductase YuxK